VEPTNQVRRSKWGTHAGDHGQPPTAPVDTGGSPLIENGDHARRARRKQAGSQFAVHRLGYRVNELQLAVAMTRVPVARQRSAANPLQKHICREQNPAATGTEMVGPPRSWRGIGGWWPNGGRTRDAPAGHTSARNCTHNSGGVCSSVRRSASAQAIASSRGMPPRDPELFVNRAYDAETIRCGLGCVTSCLCWLCAARGTEAAWAGFAGSWSARLSG